MFRIKENPDGSVSIFNNDGNSELLCTVAPRIQVKTPPKKEPVRSLRSANVKRDCTPTSPTRLILSPKCTQKTRGSSKRRKVQSTRQTNYDDSNDETASVSSYSSAGSSSSLVSTISVESSQEPDNDVLDQWSYCRMLDLMESKQFHGSQDRFRELQRSFPIRKISCQSRWQDSQRRLPKKTDNIDVSSLLGQDIVRAYPRKVNAESSEQSMSKYERFCKASVVSLQPIGWRTPLLRTRDMKTRFPVTFKKQEGYVHEYSFGLKQRLRRDEKLRTGLNHRSYLLKASCKKLRVNLTRLSQDTINRYCNSPKRKAVTSLRPEPVLPAKSTRSAKNNHVRLPNGISHNESTVCLRQSDFVRRMLKTSSLAHA